MFCKFCGAEIKEGEKFCSKCGKALEEQKEESSMSKDLEEMVNPKSDALTSPKSRLIAALLCYFLGAFGGHMFYVGKTGKAIAMLIFFWTPVVWIIAIVNFIVILCGKYEDADGLVLKKW